ncbi:GDP-perosamine synthase [subsurface metagenome]
MIITNNEQLAKFAKHITTQAKVPHKWECIHDMIGYNYRMPNVNAALGVAQLENLDKFIANKRKLTAEYKKFFDKIRLSFFTEPKHAYSNYWLNAIIFKNKTERDKFLEYTNSNGVMTRPAWRLINILEMYKDSQTGNLDNAEWLDERLVNIPSSYNPNL